VITLTTPRSSTATVGRRVHSAIALIALILASAGLIAGSSHVASPPVTRALRRPVHRFIGSSVHRFIGSSVHETIFTPGPAFNVGEVSYPVAHDFDTGSGSDTCLGRDHLAHVRPARAVRSARRYAVGRIKS
jgi:hypothetical protein